MKNNLSVFQLTQGSLQTQVMMICNKQCGHITQEVLFKGLMKEMCREKMAFLFLFREECK